MRAKEYLRQVRKYKFLINYNMEQLEEAMAMATKVTTFISDMPKGTGIGDKLADAVIRILEVEDQIRENVAEWQRRKQDAEDLVNKLQNPDYVIILYHRYFDGMTLEEIADKMGYSYKWICDLHGQALAEAEKWMTKDSSQ